MANRFCTPIEDEADFKATFTKYMRLNGAMEEEIARTTPIAYRWFERNVVGTPIRPPIDNSTVARD